MTEGNGSEARKRTGTLPYWFFVVSVTLVAWGSVILFATGTPFWLAMSIFAVSVFPFSFLFNRYLRKLPARRALVLSSFDLAMTLGLLGLLLLGLSSRYGWIQTVVEVGGGLYLLFDISMWRRRRAQAGELLVRAPKPWWLVPIYAFMAMNAVYIYFVVEFPRGAGLSGNLVALIIVIGALEAVLEAVAGTELRERGVLFFSGLIKWNQIERYEFEDRRSASRITPGWSSGLHLVLRRYPPLIRLFFGASILEKRISIALKRNADRARLEAVLRRRAHQCHDQ